MKFCQNCGAELVTGQRFCTNCGAEVTQQQTVPTETAHRKINKFWIPIIIVVALLLLGLFLFTQIDTSSKTADTIGSAIKNKDSEALSKLLSSDGESLTADQSEAFMKLLEDKGATDSFVTQLKNQAKSVPSTIRLADRPLLEIANNGKKYGILNDYQFNVASQKVQMEAQDDSTLTYSSNGKEKEVDLMKGQTVDLGTMPAGLYTIPATKSLDGTSYKGELVVDTTQSPEAQENFQVGYIKVTLNGDDSLDHGETILKVNDQQIEFDENKNQYGPFSLANELNVSAEGEVNGENFKTTSKLLTKDDFKNSMAEVHLQFNEDEISNYIAEENSKAEPKVVVIKEKETVEVDRDDNEIFISTPEEARAAALRFSGGSFNTGSNEVRTPVANATGWGFGIFDADGNPIKSFDIHHDGYVIEYDEDGSEVASGYAY